MAIADVGTSLLSCSAPPKPDKCVLCLPLQKPLPFSKMHVMKLQPLVAQKNRCDEIDKITNSLSTACVLSQTPGHASLKIQSAHKGSSGQKSSSSQQRSAVSLTSSSSITARNTQHIVLIIASSSNRPCPALQAPQSGRVVLRSAETRRTLAFRLGF